MKRILLSVVLLLVFTVSFSLGEENKIDLTPLTTAELNMFIMEIDDTIELYHELNSDEKEEILSLVEEEVETYFENKGIDISWAWIDYSYTKEWDFYTLKTHIDYEDDNGKYKPDVYAEVFPKNGELTVFYLSVGSEAIVNERNALPETLWEKSPQEVINSSTGIDISQMSTTELENLKDQIEEEIEHNHEPDYRITELVLSLTKSEVENHFIASDEEVSWPWFDYTYTREWDFYTLTTPIDHGDVDDAVVYSEAYPVDGKYELFYLSIADEVIFDNRDELPENLFATTEKSITEEKENVDTTEASVETPEPTITPEPTATPEPILIQKGSKGEEVRSIQLRLIELGYLKGAADGDYGNQTKAAVEAFQKAYSLEVTGVITNTEMTKLFESQLAAERATEISGNLTIESCELFAEMLQTPKPGNLVGQFITKYRGRTIEFNGTIAFLMQHGDYKTRFDVALFAGNYNDAKIYGPVFAFEDVNFSDMNVSGSDEVSAGMNFRITAKVEGYNSEGAYIILEPISLKAR